MSLCWRKRACDVSELSHYPMSVTDAKPQLQMMYAGSKLSLVKETDLTKVYEVRELEELTDEWLVEKLQK